MQLLVITDILDFNPEKLQTIGFRPLSKEQDMNHALVRGEIANPPHIAGRAATLTASWLKPQDYRTILDVANN